MTVKKIMVPLRGEPRETGVLDHALALARRSDAHIDVVHARLPASEFLSQSMMVTQATRRSMQQLAEQEANERERRARQLFEDYCRANELPLAADPAAAAGRVTIGWHERPGSHNTVVGLWGRLADVVAVAQPRRDGDPRHDHQTVEAALFHSGKLVLLCPPGPVGPSLGAHIAIAWNGATEAARLVTTALPLLQTATTVSILQVKDGSPELAAADLMDYLAWWGIEAGVHEFRHEPSIGRELYGNAQAIGADVMLMGAYGHSRSREMVLGGASREVIESTGLPVLLLK
jgi:nucleotide-binding universal stress UspA family protein